MIEKTEMLEDLIAESETRRAEQMTRLHRLSERGQSTDDAVQALGQIENTLAGLRARQGFVQALGKRA